MPKPKAQNIVDKIVARQRHLLRGKREYAKADLLEAELVVDMPLGEKFALPDGTFAERVDPFVKGGEAIKAWKPVGVGRWAIKITNA